MRRVRILATVPIDHLPDTCRILESIGEVVYKKYPARDELLAALPGVHGLFPNARTQLDPALLDAAKDLRVISTPSIGTDHIDLGHCKRKGIEVLSLATERELMRTVSSTAEHAFALMLAVIKKVPWGHQSVLEGKWSAAEFRGRDLQGRCLGIAGYGAIGSQLSKFARAFGMSVVVYDPYVQDLDPWAEKVGLDEFLRRAHIVTLHTPLTPETEGMVDKSWFDRMNGTILINASRGAVLKDQDLIAALDSGRVSAAGLDVLRGETAGNIGAHPLVGYARTHSNVLITPHVAGSSLDGQVKTFAHAASRLARYFKEKPIP